MEQQIEVHVSQAELLCSSSQIEGHLQVCNNSEGFAEVLQWLHLNGVVLKEVLFLLDYAGGYEDNFLCFCLEQGIAFIHSVRFGH